MIRSGPDVYSSDSSTVSSPFPETFLRRFTSLFTAAGLSLTSLQLNKKGPKIYSSKGCTQRNEDNITRFFSFTLNLSSSNRNLEMGHLPMFFLILLVSLVKF